MAGVISEGHADVVVDSAGAADDGGRAEDLAVGAAGGGGRVVGCLLSVEEEVEELTVVRCRLSVDESAA